MKLLSSFLIAVSGFAQLQQSNPNNPETCFAQDIDIDGNFWRSNVIKEFTPVASAAECQLICRKNRDAGCAYFVWEATDLDCTLYSGLAGLEHDKDAQAKWLGPVDNCIGCHREGWNYGMGYLVGNGYVGGVSDVYKCAQVCQFSNDCKYASFDKANNNCYLKSEAAETADAVYLSNYQTTTKGCLDSNCVLENRNYENGWITRYDIITRKMYGGVPGVSNAHLCHKMCQSVKECEFWTWDQNDKNCYLTKTEENLVSGNNKTSGSSDCIEYGDNHFNQFGQKKSLGQLVKQVVKQIG